MKQEKIWGLIILVLIALSAWVIVGTHYDSKTHQRVANYPTKYGLDIRGGLRAILQAHPERAPGVDYNQAVVQQILENRINGAGVGEATVQPKGKDQFVVELPDVKNKDAILKLLGTTAQLKFYYFQDVANPHSSNSSIANRPVQILYPSDGRGLPRDAEGRELYTFSDQRTGQTFRDGAQILADWNALLDQAKANAPSVSNKIYVPPPPDPALADALKTDQDTLTLTADAPVYFNAAQQAQADALNHELSNWNGLLASSLRANNGQPVLTGNDIAPDSKAQLGGNGGATQPVVTQSFKPDGTRKYGDFTSAHVGEIVGIVLDDRVISAPYIESAILDGQGEISGGFSTLAEAKSLADLLNAGSLPVPLTQEETEEVEASLGGPALHNIEVAGLVGLALVLAFMLLYYRLPGLVADIALLIYAVFTLAIFKGA